MSDARYAPKIGDTVWFNYPDSPDPMGKVVGFCTSGPREGQPVIEGDDGKQVVTHPMFLLPFPIHGEEWQKANAEGRVG